MHRQLLNYIANMRTPNTINPSSGNKLLAYYIMAILEQASFSQILNQKDIHEMQVLFVMI